MTPEDCRMLTAALTELTPAQLALLFGLLCGEYKQAPGAHFWKVIAKFLTVHVTAHSRNL